MATNAQRACPVCGLYVDKLETCKSCNLELYCSEACRVKSLNNNHNLMCQSCSACGKYSGLLSPSVGAGKNRLFCPHCLERVSSDIPMTIGWQRGGGPVGGYYMSRDGQLLELDDADSSEDDDINEREDYDTAALGMLVGNKRTLLNPIMPSEKEVDETTSLQNVPDQIRRLTRELRSIVNSRFSKTKDENHQKLKVQVLDSLTKAEEFTGEVLSLLNVLKKVLTEKKLDETKISNAATNLRERCGGDVLHSNIDKLIKEAEADVAAREAQLKAVESLPQTANHTSKSTVEKISKTIADVEKNVIKITNENTALASDIKALEESMKKEQVKMAKEKSSLHAQIEANRKIPPAVEATNDVVEELDSEMIKLTEYMSTIHQKRKMWNMRMTALSAPEQRVAQDCYLCTDRGIPRWIMCPFTPCAHPICVDCLIGELQNQEKTGKFRITKCDECSSPVWYVGYWSKSTGEYFTVPIKDGRLEIHSSDVETDFPSKEEIEAGFL